MDGNSSFNAHRTLFTFELLSLLLNTYVFTLWAHGLNLDDTVVNILNFIENAIKQEVE